MARSREMGAAGRGRSEYRRPLRSEAVAYSLRRRVAGGQWQVGDRLPSERRLAEAHDVSVNTVRTAVGALVREGLLRRVQGSGTYVVSAVGRPEKPLIGVVFPAAKYYTSGIIEGISEVSSRARQQVLISYSTFEPQLEIERCAELMALGARGLILSPSFYNCRDPSLHLQRLQSFGVPVVLVDRSPPASLADRTSYAATDRESAVRIAIKHLLSLGRRRIGYFGTPGAASREVRDAFLGCLRESGLVEIRDAIAEQRPWLADDLREYVRRCAEEQIDAVFCMDDRKAAILIPVLENAGRSVPRDVSVVAYDDADCELATVPLTTVSLNKVDLGRMAMEILIRRLARGRSAAVCHVELQPSLTVRQSCGAQAAGCRGPEGVDEETAGSPRGAAATPSAPLSEAASAAR